MQKKQLKVFALALGLVSAIPAVAAVNLPKEGSYDYVACWTGSGSDVAAGKDYTANSYEIVGTIVSMIPAGFGDQTTFRCVGMNTMIKGKAGGGNVCEATDPDGDKRLASFQLLPDGKFVREFLTGTGKYEGMTLTTTVAPLPPLKESKPGNLQGCNRQTGTYKLR